EDEDEERRLAQVLLQRQVDGILVVTAGQGAETIRLCREHEVACVAVDRPPADGGVDVVRADAEGGAHELGQLLAGLGHQRIVILTGPASVRTASDRVAGFRRAVVDEAGLQEPQVIHGAFTIDSGHAMALEAMQAVPRPTAVFAANNFIAIGVLHALDELGLRVPEDVAVVGFDDLPEAMVTFPFLTVVAQPAFEIGRESVSVLLSRLGDPDSPPRQVVLPARLVIRRSSGRPVTAGAR
ncbi:MAG TPA: substrate-binding domain-containing protein, partial [Candidatus Limnocylindrales bacterium]